MSLQAHRMHRSHHHCACGRPAHYATASNPRQRARKDHPLCARCWRSGLDRARAEGRTTLAPRLRQQVRA